MTAPGIRWSREFIPVRKRGAIQIMVGRPRKSGRRQPNGQLARGYVNPKAQVCAQPHRVVVMAKYRDRPEAESNFGRTMLRQVITPAQYAAGMAFAELAAAFCAVYDIPSPHPHAMDLTRVGVSQGREIAPDIADRIKVRYRRAFEACCEAGDKAQRAVKDAAVIDRPVSDFGALGLLRAGLDKLVHHFGIDPALPLDRKRQITESRT